jgi:hypothetical protein
MSSNGIVANDLDAMMTMGAQGVSNVRIESAAAMPPPRANKQQPRCDEEEGAGVS